GQFVRNDTVARNQRRLQALVSLLADDETGFGVQTKIELGDDVSDPKQGISVANKFAADGVKFVIGHFNSGVSIPASEVYAENGIIEITPAAT
ncbi:hypothetical protein ACC724_38150, partial [Rhizobium ruizarguesonis]